MLSLSLGLGARSVVGLPSSFSLTSNTIGFTGSGGATGTYWNGEPYIVSGGSDVTITDTDPDSFSFTGNTVGGTAIPGMIVHGMMVNPAQGTNGWASTPQGFTSAASGLIVGAATTLQVYSGALNVDPAIAGPLVITTPSKIVKARVNTAAVPNNLRDTNSVSLTSDLAMLTVVSSAPPANAFRPPMRGPDTVSYFTTDDVDISFLPNVAPVGTPTAYSTLLGYVSKLYQTAYTNNLFTRQLNASAQQASYGRDIASQLEDVLLTLCTNALTTEQKRALMNGVCQLGLDILGAVADGATWATVSGSFGGGQHWVKPVAIVTAYALRNAANSTKAAELLELVDPAQAIFAPEDRVFKYVDRLQIETFPQQVLGRTLIPYFDYMEGAPMWNSKPSAPISTGSSFGEVYRQTVAGSSAAAALALRMMGLGGTAYMPAVYYDYLDFFWDWSKIETFSPSTDAPSTFKGAMLDALLPTYSTNYSVATAPTLVRTVARGAYVWFEFDRLLSRRFVPADTAFTVLVNGSPATVVSASNAHGAQPFTNRSPDVYGKSLAVRLSTPVAQGDTVTIAYTQPGSNQARTLAGTFVASIAATAATNVTGTLPDAAASIDRVNGQTNLARASRQISATTTPTSATIGWLQVSARFRIKSITLNDTLISNSSGSTTAFWLYWASTTQLRLYFGQASADRIDLSGASTNLPLNTDITMHLWFDYSQTTIATAARVRFVWSGGSWEPTLAVTARSASTPNIATIFTGGIHVGGPVGVANREADMDHTAYLLRWGSGAAPTAPNFADAQFAFNADWGVNGGNPWGAVPQRYYAGTLAEWNGGVPNRGNGMTAALAPAKFAADGEESLTEYVAGV